MHAPQDKFAGLRLTLLPHPPKFNDLDFYSYQLLGHLLILGIPASLAFFLKDACRTISAVTTACKSTATTAHWQYVFTLKVICTASSLTYSSSGSRVTKVPADQKLPLYCPPEHISLFCHNHDPYRAVLSRKNQSVKVQYVSSRALSPTYERSIPPWLLHATRQNSHAALSRRLQFLSAGV